MTSVEVEVGRQVAMDVVRERVVKEFARAFHLGAPCAVSG